MTEIQPLEVADIQGQAIDTLIIDVRELRPEWQQVHINGAQHVPLDQLDPLKELADQQQFPDRKVFIICHAGGRGRRAHSNFCGSWI